MNCHHCKKKIRNPNANQRYHHRCAMIVLRRTQEKRRRRLGYRPEKRRNIWTVILSDPWRPNRFYHPLGEPI